MNRCQKKSSSGLYGAREAVTLVYCGQTVGQIKMKLGVQVALGPGHIVLDGDPAPHPKKGGTVFPNFRPMSIAAKWLDESRCHLVWRQGRNHIFKVGGPIPWSMLLYRTKCGWYTQFCALQAVA